MCRKRCSALLFKRIAVQTNVNERSRGEPPGPHSRPADRLRDIRGPSLVTVAPNATA
jgi:hypothetical protein